MLAIKYKNLLTHKRVLATKKIKKKKIINRIKYKKYIYTYSIHNSYGVKGDVQKKKGIKKIPHFQNSLIHKHFLDLNLRLQMNVHNLSVCTDKYNYSY